MEFNLIDGVTIGFVSLIIKYTVDVLKQCCNIPANAIVLIIALLSALGAILFYGIYDIKALLGIAATVISSSIVHKLTPELFNKPQGYIPTENIDKKEEDFKI